MTMYLAAGTQSASGRLNYLYVMKMSDLQEMEEEQGGLCFSEISISIHCFCFLLYQSVKWCILQNMFR